MTMQQGRLFGGIGLTVLSAALWSLVSFLDGKVVLLFP